MIGTVESTIDNQGNGGSETALLSEERLSEDWLTAEEDEAWSHLELEP